MNNIEMGKTNRPFASIKGGHMFNSSILDVTISLIFIYLLLSLICTAVIEWIEGMLKKRSVMLEKGIRQLLDDKTKNGLTSKIYNHPLVYSLFPGKYDASGSKRHLPSYIQSRNFALALTSIVLENSNSKESSIHSLRVAINKMEDNEKVKGALLALIDDAGDNIDKARENIEKWYDSGMERISGQYKRYIQLVTLGVALIIAIFVNADTINIATRLSYDASMRQALVAAAQEYAKTPTDTSLQPNQTSQISYALVVQGCDTPECRVDETLGKIEQLGLPIGWKTSELPSTFGGWLTRALGWIITAFAISLGAPFWFDLLNKIVMIRSAVKPEKEKTATEAGK
jgi:hypothetical protein